MGLFDWLRPKEKRKKDPYYEEWERNQAKRGAARAKLDKALQRHAHRLAPGRGWTFDIAGESFYQDALRESYRRHGGNGHDLKVIAVVRPDNDIAEHPAAVRIEIDGRVVGHLPSGKGEVYRHHIQNTTALIEGAACEAKIVGGYTRADGSKAYFGVRLKIAWPPRLSV